MNTKLVGSSYGQYQNQELKDDNDPQSVGRRHCGNRIYSTRTNKTKVTSELKYSQNLVIHLMSSNKIY